MGAGGEPHAGKGAFHQGLARFVQGTEPAHHLRRHGGVAGDGGAGKALCLDGPGGLHPGLHRRGGLGGRTAADGLILHRGHVHVQIDAVQKRSGDLLHVPLHLPGRAGAPSRGVSPPAAAAGVHGGDELEPGGQMQRAGGAGHGDGALLQGLAHGLQHVPAELRQLVEEQHAVVGQGHLPGPQLGASAGEGGGRGGVMGSAEGTPGQQRPAGVRHSGHRPDAAALQRLGAGHVRQDGGQALGQHGLACAGGADEQQVVAAGGGDLQRPLHIFLTHHVREVGKRLAIRLRRPRRGGGEGGTAGKMGRKRAYVRHAVDGEPARQRGLGGVFRRDEQRPDAGRPGAEGHGQHARHRAHRPGQGQLTQKGGVRRRRRQLSGGGKHAHQNGQVVHGAHLFLPGRGQVHGDAADGELGPAVFHRRPHPLPGLPHGRVRQSHDVKSRQAAGEEALGADGIPADAGKSQGPNAHHHVIHLRSGARARTVLP